MRHARIVSISAISLVLLLIIFYLTFEPPLQRVAGLQSQDQNLIQLPTATLEATPTIIPYNTPSPREMEAIAGLTPVPYAGPETAGSTLEVGLPGARISVTLPMNFQLEGFLVDSICVYAGELVQWCPTGAWVISDSVGKYFVYLQANTGRIYPMDFLLDANPDYLDQFQWLIDQVGADKIVDVLWLREETRKGWGTPASTETSESTDTTTDVDVSSTLDNKVFLPLATEP